MRRTARHSVAQSVIILILYLSAIPTINSDGIPIEIKLWDTGRTPLAHMVDVTNGFGLNVLAEHNFLNENNIAFSPYGLLGILVALYEGVDGESSYQIQRAMQLPWNRNVMRIGFRDIHRTLKTYFVPEEGFLAGLALNNENVTFNDEYKTILGFYGFDLDGNEQIPTLAPPSNSSNDASTSTNSSTAAPVTTASSVIDNSSTSPVTMTSVTESPTREETSQPPKSDTTLNPNAETVNEIDIRGGDATTPSPSVSTESENAANTVEQPTSRANDVEVVPSASTESTNADNTAEQPASAATMAEVVSSTEAETQMSREVTSAETTSLPAEQTSPASPTSNNVAERENEVELLSTQMMPDIAAENTTAEASTSENAQKEMQSTITEEFETTTSETVVTSSITNQETLQRRKKSVVDFIFSHPPYVDDYLIYKAYEVPIAEGPKYFHDNMFLVNGLRNVQVNYMQYDSVLDHAYLPHLEASALRLPLDSDRYYLLVILPTRGGAAELGRLLHRMARESDLSDIYTVLRPRRVSAIVPSFTVKGHITLTTDLQKLGIRDVFEPRQRDFTPMTRQGGVYVRSVEQAVSVAIRKYRADHKTNRYMNYPPVQFSATYPFLYFVMDSSIHVALMAGKMVDPLNSRIL